MYKNRMKTHIKRIWIISRICISYSVMYLFGNLVVFFEESIERKCTVQVIN